MRSSSTETNGKKKERKNSVQTSDQRKEIQ